MNTSLISNQTSYKDYKFKVIYDTIDESLSLRIYKNRYKPKEEWVYLFNNHTNP